ncbi:MAG: serine/threonine protein kinase [Kofleriaceae bacterium]|nr:serine/threonine protein kinase [Kofleriaceae bacterium]MBP9168505.1 serine/threonine protein kinase [Kofleriaceae bacterium]MBP9859718.1 serine/threonine protein kinase [Kofleriaceae bacterium]
MSADDPASRDLTSLVAAPTIAASPSASRAEPARGATIGRYLVLDRLGRGGMGLVVSAYDPELDRRVAIKLLAHLPSRDSDASEGQLRLVREAKAMARLSHPNVVPVYDAGTHDGDVFVAMELCPGGTLGQWLRAEAPPWPARIAAFVAAGRGLAAAHAAGMIHRDFKPDNVLGATDGSFKVSDFGLVALGNQRAGGGSAEIPRDLAAARALTETGAVVGTPRYMAPEQWHDGAIDARTDQFSFCASLYEALWPDRVAATATFAALAAADEVAGPTDDDPVPAAVRRAIVRGLALAPADRHASMDDLLAALTPATPRRGRALAFGAIGIAAATAAVVTAAVVGGGRGAARGPRCELPAADLDGAWTTDARDRLRASLTASGAGFAAAAADDAVASLDAYAQTWAAASRDACRAARTLGPRQAAIASARLACLDRRRDGARALVAELTDRPDAAVVAAAAEAIAELPAIADCAAAAGLDRPPPPPAIAAEVAAAERALAEVNAQLAAGRSALAARALPPLSATADRLGYPPLAVEVRLAEAELQVDRGDGLAARIALQEVTALARATGQDDLEFTAWRYLANGETHGLGHHDAIAAARMAQAIATRRDDPPRRVEAALLEARALADLGRLAQARARLAEVAPAVDQAIAANWRVGVRLELAQASLATTAGDLPAALAAERAALDRTIARLGTDHPDLAYIESRLAGTSAALQRLDDARAWMAKARARVRAVAPRGRLAGMFALDAANLSHQLGDDFRTDLAEAARLLDDALPEDLSGADLTHLRGLAAFKAGDLATARIHFAAVATTVRGRQPRLEARANENLAMTLTLQGEAVAAEAPLRRALAVRTAAGNAPWAIALTRGTLARILSAQGRHAEAEVEFAAVAAALAPPPPQAAARAAEIAVARAVNLESLGRAAEVGPLVEPAIAPLRAAGDLYHLGLALSFAAQTRWASGDRAGAHAAAAEAKAALTREGDSPAELAELAAWVRAHPAPRPPR